MDTDVSCYVFRTPFYLFSFRLFGLNDDGEQYNRRRQNDNHQSIHDSFLVYSHVSNFEVPHCLVIYGKVIIRKSGLWLLLVKGRSGLAKGRKLPTIDYSRLQTKGLCLLIKN